MGYEDRYGSLAIGALVETCTTCLYINQNIDTTATMLRLADRLIVILAMGLLCFSKLVLIKISS